MFSLNINTENDAFRRDPHRELARIVVHVAKLVAAGGQAGRCYDANGNRVGFWQLNVKGK